jgi:hypothetical protein
VKEHTAIESIKGSSAAHESVKGSSAIKALVQHKRALKALMQAKRALKALALKRTPKVLNWGGVIMMMRISLKRTIKVLKSIMMMRTSPLMRMMTKDKRALKALSCQQTEESAEG